jgi:eukaryotic-like serine/threonine-protein kinase
MNAQLSRSMQPEHLPTQDDAGEASSWREARERAKRGVGRVRQLDARRTLHGISPAERPELGPGTILAGTYYLERLLARGGMGMVYLAWDLLLEREVAVKVLLSRHAADPRVAKRFRQEAIAMASVRHANVVQVFNTGAHGALPFFAMQYVPGQTVGSLFREAFRRGQLAGLEVVSDILRQVSRGLTAMGECGVFHGNVKPSNMLINSARQVVVFDFGLGGPVGAKSVASEPGFLSGTPLYVAPELVCGADVRPDQRHLCDVYSLGASVFELLTGQGPFVGDTIRDILRGHLFTTPPKVSALRPDLPRELDAVVTRALAKNPKQRFQKCSQLSAAVDEIAQASA